MKIAVDTNRYVDFCRADSQAVQVISTAERIYIPFIVVGELRAGFLCGTRGSQNEQALTRFLNSPRVELLHSSDPTPHHYARLFQHLKSQGTPIPTNDLWIAALAVQHDLHLFARDRHFKHLPQLSLI